VCASWELVASFHYPNFPRQAENASGAKAMHKALSANLHDAKASALSKCVFEIARQIASTSTRPVAKCCCSFRKLQVRRRGASLLPVLRQLLLLLLEHQSPFFSSDTNTSEDQTKSSEARLQGNRFEPRKAAREVA
jgi:hypothetical protein